jgi:hypothetical protein
MWDILIATGSETEYPALEHNESRCPPQSGPFFVPSAEFKIRLIRFFAASVVFAL